MTTTILANTAVGPVTTARTGLFRRFLNRLIEARTHEARRRMLQALSHFGEARLAELDIKGAPSAR